MTNLFINLSAYAALTIVVAFIGVIRKERTEQSDKWINLVSIGLFIFLAIFIAFQMVFPEYSNL